MYLLFKENNKIIRKEKIDEYLIKKPILNTLRAKYLYKADYLMQEKDYSDLQKAVTDPADKQVVDFLLGKEFNKEDIRELTAILLLNTLKFKGLRIREAIDNLVEVIRTVGKEYEAFQFTNLILPGKVVTMKGTATGIVKEINNNTATIKLFTGEILEIHDMYNVLTVI